MKELHSINSIIHYLPVLLSLITILVYFSPNIACGQSSTIGTKTWLDSENNIKILFSLTPSQPVIGTATDKIQRSKFADWQSHNRLIGKSCNID